MSEEETADMGKRMRFGIFGGGTLMLALLLAACGGETEIAALFETETAETDYGGQPAVYPDPDAPDYGGKGTAYGGTQYDGNDEIVNGKCLKDHPVSYCITIDGQFKQPVGSPNYKDRARFLAGNRIFNANWVQAPQSNNAQRDGLGPIFDNRSCAGCHVRNGRGRPPTDQGEQSDSMIVRISLRTGSGSAETMPHPNYGDQFNTNAVKGARAEGRLLVSYDERQGRFSDGEKFSLRKPSYSVTDLAFGPLGKDAMISPRVAPPVIGLGLIEGVDADAILALADPDDADGDGISGRPNYAVDPADGEIKLGRYGWKAGAVTLRHQTAAALAGDMGITTAFYPAGNCGEAQTACASATDGGQPEIDEPDLGDLVFYMQLLSPTARRGLEDPEVYRGEELFDQIGCAACHVTRMTSAQHPEIPGLSGLAFHPYSDFLLHDMGEGLADGRSELEANGREWRTPPLWGLGLTKQVSGFEFYLHDGRARSLMEAVLWHGGEGAMARDAVGSLAKDDRQALISFLKSL